MLVKKGFKRKHPVSQEGEEAMAENRRGSKDILKKLNHFPHFPIVLEI